MSSRTSLTALDGGSPPEAGAVLTSLDSSDVSAGNKFTSDQRTLLYVEETSGVGKTITFTWSHRGATVTRAVTVTASSKRLHGPFPLEMTEHDSDSDSGQVWVTASGVAGDVKFRPYRSLGPL